jgi:hypothetical protein
MVGGLAMHEVDENYIQNYRKICRKDITLEETGMDRR